MRPWAPAILGALLSSACQKAEPPPPPAVALDCARPFAVMRTAIVTQPNIVPAARDKAEPYEFLTSADGKTSYLITDEGAPGHPAILMQKVRGGEVHTTGCPWGDKAGYDELHAYLDSLKTWTRK